MAAPDWKILHTEKYDEKTNYTEVGAAWNRGKAIVLKIKPGISIQGGDFVLLPNEPRRTNETDSNTSGTGRTRQAATSAR